MGGDNIKEGRSHCCASAGVCTCLNPILVFANAQAVRQTSVSVNGSNSLLEVDVNVAVFGGYRVLYKGNSVSLYSSYGK